MLVPPAGRGAFGAAACLLAGLHRRLAAAGLAHYDLNPTNVILSPRGPVVVDWANGDLPGRLLGWAFARELPAQLPPAALARRAITTPRPLRIAPSRRIRRTPAATHRFTLLRIRHAAESLLVWSPHPIRLSTDSCEIE